MSDHAILDGHRVVEVDLMTWARWFETAERHVANDQVGDSGISTVFLGLDHGFGMGAPLWFETMVFGGTLDGEMDRYTTWDEAARGHAAMVARVREVGEAAPSPKNLIAPQSDANLQSSPSSTPTERAGK